MQLDHFKGRLEKNYPLRKLNTWKIGGNAEQVFWPANTDELIEMVIWCRNDGIPVYVFGRGSNVLFPDNGIRGMVIINTHLNKSSWEDHTVRVEAGYSLMRLAREAAERGLRGMEFACGIPGTVGAAILINAGAHGGEIGKLIKEVKILSTDGRIEVLQKGNIQFSYRKSSLQDRRAIVVEGTFDLESGGESLEINEVMKGYMAKRRITQPLEYPNAGSIFLNPPGDSAGRLIEQAGWKGYRLGDAQVSDKHANFIVNRGDARSDDVINLVNVIQKDVMEKYGVRLEPEIRIITC